MYIFNTLNLFLSILICLKAGYEERLCEELFELSRRLRISLSVQRDATVETTSALGNLCDHLGKQENAPYFILHFSYSNFRLEVYSQFKLYNDASWKAFDLRGEQRACLSRTLSGRPATFAERDGREPTRAMDQPTQWARFRPLPNRRLRRQIRHQIASIEN